MSGGHFDYKQYMIDYIADSIEQVILKNKEVEWYNYSPETIDFFYQAVYNLRQAAIYAQRIDWLLSGDDGEESFHKRLNEELRKLALDQLTSESQILGMYGDHNGNQTQACFDSKD